MYIAYLNPILKTGRSAGPPYTGSSTRRCLRLKAYLSVCRKYQQEINAIRRYQPDWMPRY